MTGRSSTCKVALPPLLVKRTMWYFPSFTNFEVSSMFMSSVPTLNTTLILPFSCKDRERERKRERKREIKKEEFKILSQSFRSDALRQNKAVELYSLPYFSTWRSHLMNIILCLQPFGRQFLIINKGPHIKRQLYSILTGRITDVPNLLRTKQGDSLSDCAQFLLTAQCIRKIYHHFNSPAKGGIHI